MNMQGGNSHRQGPEVGEGPCLCSREGRPVWPGLAGRGGEGSRQTQRGPEARSGWEAAVLGKGAGLFRDPLAAQWRMGDCRGADERRRRCCLEQWKRRD